MSIVPIGPRKVLPSSPAQVFAMLILLSSGCGRAEQGCPVSGRVVVNGQPAPGIYVIFHSEQPGLKQGPAAARTDETGSYAWRVPEPGQYAITLFWPSAIQVDGETIEGPDRLLGKFRSPTEPVVTVKIDKENAVLPVIDVTVPKARR